MDNFDAEGYDIDFKNQIDELFETFKYKNRKYSGSFFDRNLEKEFVIDIYRKYERASKIISELIGKNDNELSDITKKIVSDDSGEGLYETLRDLAIFTIMMRIKIKNIRTNQVR